MFRHTLTRMIDQIAIVLSAVHPLLKLIPSAMISWFTGPSFISMKDQHTQIATIEET